MRAKTADSMAFLAQQGELPIADPDLPNCLDLALVTAAPPRDFASGKDFELAALVSHIMNFRHAIDSQTGLMMVERKGDLQISSCTKLVMGLQNVPLQTDKEALQALRQFGIRVMAIAYDDVNHLGGGFLHPTVGLTDAGCQFVTDCVELGITLDVSHASHLTAAQTVDLVRMRGGSVMASHGGIYELYPDPRNLPEKVLIDIAAAHGMVGVYTMTFGLHASCNDPTPVIDHLDRAIQICGSAAVCLGSDAVYQKMEETEWQAKFKSMQERIDPDGTKGSRWPDFPLELNGTQERIDGIRQRLRLNGLDEQVTNQVMGQNLFDFFTRTLT